MRLVRGSNADRMTSGRSNHYITAPLFNFNLVQRALVLEDYAPALGVGGGGFVSRKNGARSMGEVKKEGKNNNNNNK